MKIAPAPAPTANLPRLLTTIEVAEILRLDEASLRRWRMVGRGPKFVKFGTTVRYRETDVIDYLEHGEREQGE